MVRSRDRLLIWFAVASVAIVGGAWGGSDGGTTAREAPPEAVEHFNSGFFHASRENYDDAVREYEKAIEVFPEYGRAHHNLGMILERAGKLELAIEHFRKALGCAGLEEPWVVRNALGVALERSGDTEGAIAAYRKAIEEDPSPSFPLHNLAVALANTGDVGGALEAIRRAAELSPYDPRIARVVRILEARAEEAKERAKGDAPGASADGPSTTAGVEAGGSEEAAPEGGESSGDEQVRLTGPLVPKASPAEPGPPVAFETGDVWSESERRDGAVVLSADAGETLARVEWWDDPEASAEELAEAEVARLREVDPEARQEVWPEVDGRAAASYVYELEAEGGEVVRTRVVLAASAERAYRFAVRAEGAAFADADARFRILLESVRLEAGG